LFTESKFFNRYQIMPISFEKAFSIHDDAMIMRSRRSSVLASNIANADTPNYKARDLDFGAMFNRLDRRSGTTLKLVGTHVGHIQTSDASLDQGLKYRNPLHASLDGNTVDSHVEQAKFSENALRYQTSFTFLNGKVQGLMSALRGE
jgi:flagellar basal-body rod protein FlgB